MADYDKYYMTEDLFGKPYNELLEFFKNHEPKGNLIDIGCGQGRDSIALARLGYQVTGIDSSKLGINQMLHQADSENLRISGIVADIYEFEGYHNFDIILLDSMFHFEKKDKQREIELLNKISSETKTKGIICICIQNTGSKVRRLKEAIKNTKADFDILTDSSLIYIFEDQESGYKSETNYCMYIVRKK